MSEQPDFFRDFGIIPHGVSGPPETVRCFLPWYHIAAQYLASCLMTGLALGIGFLLAQTLQFPINLIVSGAAIAGFGYIIYLATRNDYSWVELEGDKLRARHLYTGRRIERSIEDVDDLLTVVFQIRTAETLVCDAWLGRVRGIEIRFRDKRTPIRISRVDPAMKNARQLIEAVVFRMSEKGPGDAEIIDFEGKPLIRRVYRKDKNLREKALPC